MFSRQHPSPKLPPELISTIVDHLSSDKPALKAFSLVSKAWLRQCQAHLWRSIRITHDLVRIVNVVQLLRASTVLKSYIESCTLDFELGDNRRLAMGFQYPFAILKQHLISIKSLHVCNMYPNGHKIADILSLSFHLNNVTVLVMDNVLFESADDIFRVLFRVPLLHKLHLNCTVSDRRVSSLMQEVPIPPLRIMSYNGLDSSLYQWLIDSKGALPITHLRLTNVRFHQRGLLQALLEKLGDQLEYLLIRCKPGPPSFWNPPDTMVHPFNVSSNKSLRCLCIQDGYLAKYEDKPWAWIPPILLTIESEKMQEIRWEVLSSHSSILTKVPGTAIESILAHERFSKLSTFTVQLSLVDVHPACREVEIISDLLPQLHKSGRLRIVGGEEAQCNPLSLLG